MNAEFIKKVIAVQTALKAPKNQYNSFGKYNYRSAEDILEGVKPLLAENGLLLAISDDIHVVEGWHYVRATATLTDGIDAVSVSASAREDEDEKGYRKSQLTGATSSYARKYALNGLFLIDDEKDPDTDESRRQSQKPAKQKAPEPKEASEDYMKPVRDWWPHFEKLFISRDEALQTLLKSIGAESMKSLSPAQAGKAAYFMSKYYEEHKEG